MKQIICLVGTLFISCSAWSCGNHVDWSVPHIHHHDALVTAANESEPTAPKTISLSDIYDGVLLTPDSVDEGAEHQHTKEDRHRHK